MNRRDFLTAALLTPALVAAARRSELDEAAIADLQAAMAVGKESSVSLTKKYLRRIDQIDRGGPSLNSVIELNPDALDIARQLDGERKSGHTRGPLHGIPVLIKDNIDTHDRMRTSAGSLALAESIAPQDSVVAKRLRAAGAVILGKTNLSEWANFRGDRSTSGWSGRGGLTKNPYALDRNPSGSSAGSAVAVAANLCAGAIGTETDGSIVSPSTVCGIVGLKPTVGLISRGGIIPISHSQDTAGPMTRTVRDAAILLGAVAESASGKGHSDYTKFLKADGLRGARLGFAKRYQRGNSAKVIENAIEIMKRAGAIVVDDFDDTPLSKAGSGEGDVLLYEFKAGINAYLAGLGPNAPVRTLADLIQFNEQHSDKELRYFGQETFVRAEAKGPLTDKAYLDALDKCNKSARVEGIDALMDKHQLDAIVAFAGGPAGKTDLLHGDRGVGGSSTPAAVAGYPNITVPAGEVFTLPVGISFFGRAWSEPVLLRLAYAFEQLTQARKPPKFLPTVI
ncbi:MAG TPA: amidase [Candidatus Binatia bacterium]|nr:amidase [Candidatus Binatia bacterium]